MQHGYRLSRSAIAVKEINFSLLCTLKEKIVCFIQNHSFYFALLFLFISSIGLGAQEKDKYEEKKISDLVHLEEFSDVIVIQRRYLPKTNRFELWGAGSFVINDPFFNNLGFAGKFGYFFSEFLGIELNTLVWGTFERQVTKDLRSKRGIKTESLISPVNYWGLDLRWAPFYGKMAYLNQSIVPFDFYFSAGLGMTQTNLRTSEPTLHLGTGHIFALSKSLALRWDLSWNVFSPSSEKSQAEGLHHNIFLSFGLSYYFPGAKYR